MSEKKQFIQEDKSPKLLGKPTIQAIIAHDHTDRSILWLISISPYAFNPLYTGQFIIKNPDFLSPNHNFSKAYKIVDSLKIRRLIKQDKNMNFRITLIGQLYRISTHPAGPLVYIIIGAIMTILIEKVLTLLT